MHRQINIYSVLFVSAFFLCHLAVIATPASYGDDIRSLLNQASSACNQAEAEAGQSFGCSNLNGLYGLLNQSSGFFGQGSNFFGQNSGHGQSQDPLTSMIEQGVQAIASAFTSSDMNFGQSQPQQQSYLPDPSQYHNQAARQWAKQKELHNRQLQAQETQNQIQTQQKQQARVLAEREAKLRREEQALEEERRKMEKEMAHLRVRAVQQNGGQHRDNDAGGERGGFMNIFRRGSLKESYQRHYGNPYYSQHTYGYEDPERPNEQVTQGGGEDQDQRNQGDNFQDRNVEENDREFASRETAGTPFFGRGPAQTSITNESYAVPASFDQAPGRSLGATELVSKRGDSFDFDGTGNGDNRIFFKKKKIRQAPAPYDVSSAQSQTLRSSQTPSDYIRSRDIKTGLRDSKGSNQTDYWANFFKPASDFIERSQRQLAQFKKKVTLYDALQTSALDPAVIGNKKCNYYVSALGKQMDIPYFRRFTKQDIDNRYANQMYGFIEQAVREPKKSGWRKITDMKEVQRLADEGKLVVVVAKHKDATPEEVTSGHPKGQTNHGHIAVVVPKDLKRVAAQEKENNWPWIRDSQHAGQSVRANRSFNSISGKAKRNGKVTVSLPIFAVWEGDSPK